MAEYIVSIDNEEISEAADNLSITGRVNGIQCATVVRNSTIEALEKKEAKQAKQRALIDGYINRQKSVSSSAGEKVTI